MSVFGYIRVSSQIQVLGYGLELQAAAIKAYCKSHKLHLDRIVQDAGISGTDLERPGIQKLLELLKPGDVLIVRSIDRLWRDDLNRIRVGDRLRELQVQLVSLEEPAYNLQDQTPADYLIRSLLESLAVYSKLEIVGKLKAGKARRVAAGLPGSGRVKYGYKVTSKGLELDPSKAPLLKQAFIDRVKRLPYQDRCKSLRAIAQDLGLSRSRAHKVLSDPCYYRGYLVYSGTKIPCPVLVSKAVWERAQNVNSKI